MRIWAIGRTNFVKRQQRLLAISIATVTSTAIFAGAAQAEDVTPQVVKPEVVTPHVTGSAPAPSTPVASPAPSPASPSQPPAAPAATDASPTSAPAPQDRIPANPRPGGGRIGLTCPNLTLCEGRQRDEEDAKRSREADLRLWGMVIQGAPWAVAWAMDANPYELWPPNSSATFAGAGDEISDALGLVAAGAFRLFEEIRLKLN